MMNRSCPICGTHLDDSVVTGGLCPVCLLRQAETSLASLDRAARDRSTWQPPSVEELTGVIPGIQPERFVGRGGFGAVYAARQVELDRPVALKLLPFVDTTNPLDRERYKREARALARVDHPGAVAVHTAGIADGLAYLILEWIDGGELTDLLRFGPLELDATLDVGIALAEALAAAHAAGVVHRDLKPSNILIRWGWLSRRESIPAEEGRVVLTDFGIARLADRKGTERTHQVTLTGRHEILGTPAYMAPEQRDPSASVDARCDLYALGVLLHEMATGKRPGHTAGPSSEVPENFRQLVARCTAENPADRPAGAQSVADELRGIQISQSKYSHPLTAFGVTLMIGLFIAGFLTAYWLDFGSNTERRIDPIPRAGSTQADGYEPSDRTSEELQPQVVHGTNGTEITKYPAALGPIEISPWGGNQKVARLHFRFTGEASANPGSNYVLIITSATGVRIEQSLTGFDVAQSSENFFQVILPNDSSNQQPYIAYVEEYDAMDGQRRISPFVVLPEFE